MITGTKAMAQRIVNAEERFITHVIDAVGCTYAEAEKVLAVYRKAKVIKMDAVGGRITVKHGAFWDEDVIRNAIATA